MVNRIDKLQLELIDKKLFFAISVPNVLMNSRVLRFSFVGAKFTIQVFLSKLSAMIMCNKTSEIEYSKFLSLLPEICGIRVVQLKIVTSVWVFQAIPVIGDLRIFLNYCRKTIPELQFEYEPELFPLLTVRIKKENSKKSCVTARISHKAKIVFLGIQNVSELIEPLRLLSALIFDFSMFISFSNI